MLPGAFGDINFILWRYVVSPSLIGTINVVQLLFNDLSRDKIYSLIFHKVHEHINLISPPSLQCVIKPSSSNPDEVTIRRGFNIGKHSLHNIIKQCVFVHVSPENKTMDVATSANSFFWKCSPLGFHLDEWPNMAHMVGFIKGWLYIVLTSVPKRLGGEHA